MPFCARLAALGLLVIALAPGGVSAQETQPVPDAAFRIRTAFKSSALVFRAPDAPELFPSRTGGESIWRIRVEPEIAAGTRAVFSIGYEQRLRYRSGAAGVATAGILPAHSAAPFRVRALDWSLTESSTLSWRHEIDRANARLHFAGADVTIGRQAIGWGRGVMFGAVDLFAPFSPLEADREWRRGVDAVRADVKLTDRSSVDMVAAFGRTADRSAVAARLRGYTGPADLEVMAGRRARDLFAGMTTSAAIGDAAAHGEVAMFRVPPADARDSRIVWKALAGGSYRLPVGSGVLAYAEYHYSGFGATRPEEILWLLSTAAFAERYLRGDTQILSRHAVAVTASYELSPEYSFSGQWVHNPRDRSGILVSGVALTFSDQARLLGTAYGPYGRAPQGRLLRSEYGTSGLTVLLQLRVYL